MTESARTVRAPAPRRDALPRRILRLLRRPLPQEEQAEKEYLLSSYTDADGLMAAIKVLLAANCRVHEVFTPYPVHGLDALLAVRRSRLGLVTGAAALAGGGMAFGFQYWSSAVSWSINVGGKPDNSWPAFIPITFELTVLCAGTLTALAFLLRSRLFPGALPPGIPRVNDDRFALLVRVADTPLPHPQLHDLLGATACESIEEWGP